MLKNELFHQYDTQKGSEDAKQHIDDVVMARVDGCPPDAHADASKCSCDKPASVAHGSIDGGDEHIGCMQTGHGSKDIGIVAIDGVKYRNAYQGIEASQSRHIAWCA